jgi:hypothetical protein
MSLEVYARMLLVEGRDDQYVLREMLRHHGIASAIPKRDPVRAGDIVIDGRDGFQGVRDTMSIIRDDGDLKQLGVIVDANADIEARWMSLCKVLYQFGDVDVPETPEPGGTIVLVEQDYRSLTVGIWIMPDNALPGELEHFVDFMIPEDDPLRARARECLDGIPESERRFPEHDWIKAYVHTWLAWQKTPGMPLGQAISAGCLDADAPHAQQVIGWIRRLFDL